LTYTEEDRETGHSLSILPLVGSDQPKPFLRTRFQEGTATFSPDGHWLAFVYDESGRPEVYVATVADIRHKYRISAAGGFAPRWRRDGKELFSGTAMNRLPGSRSAEAAVMPDERLAKWVLRIAAAYYCHRSNLDERKSHQACQRSEMIGGRRIYDLAAALVLAAAVAPANGQVDTRTVSLTGQVVDQTGAVVPRASITVRRLSTGVERRVEANAEGVFSIAELQPGDYEVSASSAGFAAALQRVALRTGENRLRFELRLGNLTEDVLVVAGEIAGSHERLRRLPSSVDIVDRETLEQSRVMTTNEALRKVAGVHVRDEEGFGLRPNIGIRGLNPTRSTKVLLMEDGIPLTYAPYGDNASYYHPPIDRFERLEVMKGGAQIAYGPQTIGGAVNYLTPKPPMQRSGSLTLMGGNREYFNGHGSYGATIGRTGFLVDYMRKQGDGARENLNFKLNDVNGKVVHGVGADQTWTCRSNYYSEDSNVTYSGLRQDEYLANRRANPFSNDSSTPIATARQQHTRSRSVAMSR
jgi:outer membrane receptor protein involved in Fe transport